MKNFFWLCVGCIVLLCPSLSIAQNVIARNVLSPVSIQDVLQEIRQEHKEIAAALEEALEEKGELDQATVIMIVQGIVPEFPILPFAVTVLERGPRRGGPGLGGPGRGGPRRGGRTGAGWNGNAIGPKPVVFHLAFRVKVVISPMYIDPVVAVGYNYFVDSGPRAISVKLPKGIGDNKYDLWLYEADKDEFVDSGIDITGGELYLFKEALREFSIRGIEIDANLDPENQEAFPTGITFEYKGKVKMRMISVSVDTDNPKAP